MNSVNKIDWGLFSVQKQGLLDLRDNKKITQEEADVLDGVINLMDAIQDDFKPTDDDEYRDGTEDHDTDDRNPNRNGRVS